MNSLPTESFKYNNEEKWFQIIIKCNECVSVNYMYGRTKYGKIFLLPHISDYKNKIKEQIALADPVKYCKEWLNPNNFFHLQIQFIIKHSFLKRDLDNFQKATQDAIFPCLGVDDSRIIELSTKKSYRAGDDEYLIIRVSKSDFEWDFFNK